MTNEEIAQHLRLQGEQIAEMMKQLQKMQEAADALAADAPPKPAKLSSPYVMEKPDFTAGLRMPASATAAMVAAVPDNLMKSIVSDHFGRSSVHSPSSIISDRPRAETKRGSGWVDPIPLKPPPGVEVCDRLLDAADAADRAELKQRLGGKE